MRYGSRTRAGFLLWLPWDSEPPEKSKEMNERFEKASLSLQLRGVISAADAFAGLIIK